MILEFSDDNFVDIDSITALRWLKEVEKGIAVLGKEKIVFTDRKEFDVVLKAYRWTYPNIYKYDHKKFKGE